MSEKKVIGWYTSNGKHIPIFESENENDKREVPERLRKLREQRVQAETELLGAKAETFKKVKKSTAEQNEDIKAKQIAQNKEQADILNKKEEPSLKTIISRYLNYGDSEVDKQLKSAIEQAKADGYETIPIKFVKKSNGRFYEMSESQIKTTVGDNRKISKSTKVYQHYLKTKEKYDDVILLQCDTAVRGYTRSHKGFRSTGLSCYYQVMAKGKKQ